MHRISLPRIDVWSRPGDRRRGWIAAGSQRIAVALGRTGIKADKREGDGATPARPLPAGSPVVAQGPFAAPAALLPARPIDPADGWCEDPADRRYNQADPARTRRHRRPAHPQRLALRPSDRDRPQYAAPDRRPRQRRFHPRGPARPRARPPAASPCRPPP